MQQAARERSVESSSSSSRNRSGSASSSATATRERPVSGEEQRVAKELHGGYRTLIEAVKESVELLSNPVNKDFGRISSDSQRLFQNVRTTRDAALDSELTAILARIEKERVLHINTAPKGFDCDSYTRALCEILCVSGNSAVPAPAESPSVEAAEKEARHMEQLRKWALLCRIATGPWRCALGVDAMYGPMHPGAEVHDDNPAPPKQRVIRTQDNKHLEKTKAIDASNISSKGEAKTGRLVELVTTSLKKATQNGPIELWRFVINPESFGQSVENLFYVSFLIKDGQAALETRGDTLFIKSAVPPKDADYDSGHAQKKQCIATMNTNMFEELKERYSGPPIIDRSVLEQDDQDSSMESQELPPPNKRPR